MHVCDICNYKGKMKRFEAVDCNENLSDKVYTYFSCPDCGTMRLASPLGGRMEYASNYGSFVHIKKKSINNSLRVKCDLYNLTGKGMLGRLYSHFIMPQPYMRVIRKTASRHHKILDIGCGDGYLLNLLADLGYKNLTGIDLYIPDELAGDNGKFILKKGTIEDAENSCFDLIISHHSFEHMEKPVYTMQQMSSKLKNNGSMILSIPIAGSHLFKRYGANWHQLDAPRHKYIHSVIGIDTIAGRAGLKIADIIYDTNSFSYFHSEKLARHYSLKSVKNMMNLPAKYHLMSQRDNRNHLSDQATFILKKI